MKQNDIKTNRQIHPTPLPTREGQGGGSARYMARGVSAAKEDVHAAIKNIDKGIFPQAFCKIIPDILGGDPEYCNIMHADGAGTKSSLAYAYWRETGDLSVWKGIAQDALIMNTDDLLCVGAVDNILVSSTIGRNKMLIPGEVISAIINGTDELLSELRDMGIGIYATGGETADVGDLVRTIIVDSTVTCRMKRSDVINNALSVSPASDRPRTRRNTTVAWAATASPPPVMTSLASTSPRNTPRPMTTPSPKSWCIQEATISRTRYLQRCLLPPL